MNRNSGIIKLSALLLVIILTGCNGRISLDIETPTSTLTYTPEPTYTLTLTPTSTNTPVPPTPTVVPPSVLLEYLNGVVVSHIDSFESTTGWDLYAGSISNGSLEIIGNDWNGLMKRGSFSEGEGIIVDFKYDKNSEFEVFFDYGEFGTDPYRRLGIYVSSSYPKANLWLGKNGLGFNNLYGNFKTKPDTWYSLLMALDENGEFLAIVWDPIDTSRVISYHEGAREKWAGLTWDFRIGANAGTIVFDDFMEITFDEIK